MSTNHEADSLAAVVILNSVADNWREARTEWYVSGKDTLDKPTGVCKGGHLGLMDLYEITNHITGMSLYPIGSACIKRFEDDAMDRSLARYDGIDRARETLSQRGRIELDDLTRHTIDELDARGVFAKWPVHSADPVADHKALKYAFNVKNKRDFTPDEAVRVESLLAAISASWHAWCED